MKRIVYKELASCLVAIGNCKESDNTDWNDKWHNMIDIIEREYLPHGSGIDNGVKLDREKSTKDKLILTFDFHFMDDNGFYDGWESYRLIVTPSLLFDVDMKIIGPNRREIKEYLYSLFYDCLMADIGEDTYTDIVRNRL